MTASLKQLAVEVRRVWNPPGARPWSFADVAIVKLLKAIEDHQPGDETRAAVEAERVAARRRMLEAAIRSFESIEKAEGYDYAHREAAAWATDHLRTAFKLTLESGGE